MNRHHCDVAVIGGGFGAIAATLALLDNDLTVVLTDEYAWIGGQVTSQALNVPDEMNYPAGEHAGFNRSYYEYRNRIRRYYTDTYKLSEFGRSQLYLNPGNALCSGVAAESVVAHNVIVEWLTPYVQSGHLTIINPVVPVQAVRNADKVLSVTCAEVGTPSNLHEIAARFFLDGTETGDTYPLLDIGYRLGSDAKAEFGEPHADDQADQKAVQCFTFCMAAEFVPGGDFTIDKPANYEALREAHEFHLNVPGATYEDPAKFYHGSFSKQGSYRTSFFHYRSTLDTRNFEPSPGLYDRAVINVGCNDFFEEAYLENPDKESVLERARELSRAYLYWLQTEAPRDSGGFGYPEIRLRPEDTGTVDGLAQAPYVREGRRLKACQTVVEQDITGRERKERRARHFANSVGLGGFLIDIHKRAGNLSGAAEPASPYQIPLGSLVSPELSNFAVANKGIGVSQIANGAYRLHPIEWAIGEAAGVLAAYCLEHEPPHPNLQSKSLLNYQTRLLLRGAPIYWFEDLAHDDPSFVAAQLLATKRIWPGDPHTLRFDGHLPIAHVRREFNETMERLGKGGLDVMEFGELHNIAHNTRKSDAVYRLYRLIEAKGWPEWTLRE
ncbi:MAG: FAD-dependent oxidoreductase [Capsulimonadaceae bacterium]|nr:FAD-dependent oxidoreductase [Capsulimonadaceae bacterium]